MMHTCGYTSSMKRELSRIDSATDIPPEDHDRWMIDRLDSGGPLRSLEAQQLAGPQPQEGPQDDADADAEDPCLLLPLVAKTEKSFSRAWLWQEGHTVTSLPRTNVSNV
jgi:hypothetical protein